MKIQGFYSSSSSSLLTDLRNAYGSTRNLINELILISDSSFAVLIEVNKQKSNFTITIRLIEQTIILVRAGRLGRTIKIVNLMR